MKFLKFWREHSLREAALIFLVFLAWAWISGYIHWWAYNGFAGENHWQALIVTVVIWMGVRNCSCLHILYRSLESVQGTGET